MKCVKCEKKAVYSQSGTRFCKDHFLDNFETKVFKTIRKHELIKKGDKVCVATSGGKDSLCVLYMVMKYCKKYGIEFFALVIDEGIAGYRDKTIIDLQKFCDKYSVDLHVESFKKRFGKDLDSVKGKAAEKLGKKPCTVCGILRRKILNEGAKKYGATKLATGHNLDDESQSYFMNILKGNMGHNASLGPIVGFGGVDGFVQRIKPLYYCLEKETRLFSFLKGFNLEFVECPNINLSFRMNVRDQLNTIESKFPGAKNGIVNAFMEIMPTLKEKYSGKKNYGYCKECGDPASGDICNACVLEKEISEL
jgi:uncharacterized protein (TIGR00269 family)